MKDTDTVKKAGPPWKIIAIFKDYKAASDKRESLREKYEDKEIPMQLKVKRIGDGGLQFALKGRLDPSATPAKKTKTKKKKNEPKKT